MPTGAMPAGAESTRRRPLRVVVDARLRNAEGGGVASVITGLAAGLSGLADADDEYLFLVRDGQDAWLRPFLGGPCRTLGQSGASSLQRRLKARVADSAPILRSAWWRLPARVTGADKLPKSAGVVEAAGADVIHFVNQTAFLTSVPSIYHPHDLQHVHLPEFFSPLTRAMRERQYRAFAEQATMVAVASTWTKGDVVGHFDLPEDKVVVVPWAPPLAAVAELSRDEAMATAARLGLPPRYLMYPARTWPHKNHAVLIEAACLLRRREGIDVSLVFTGYRTNDAEALDAKARQLGIEDLVTWTGFLSPRELRAAYALADGVVIPSLFEAASAPLWEAWVAGKAAACSNVTSLPDQAGDAAIVFDPSSVEAVADAMARLWTRDDERAALARLGAQRVATFTWERTARTFRAHYRRIAGIAPSEEDARLLSAPPGI